MISELTRSYIPEFEQRLGEYQEQTGKGYRELGEELKGLYEGYTGDVETEKQQSDIAQQALSSSYFGAGSAFEKLQQAAGGGSTYGASDILSTLESDYFDNLWDTSLQDYPTAKWYG